MRAMVLGCGGVGEVVVKGLVRTGQFECITAADLREGRARLVAEQTGEPRVVAAKVDASDRGSVQAAIRGHDLVIHAGIPRHNLVVMEACLAEGAHYIDMAADGPVDLPGMVTVQQQMAYDQRFRERGLLALLGIGVDPGLTNIFARWASDRLDRVDEIVIYDGDNSTLTGYDFALPFSPDTSIEECLMPPLGFFDGRFVTGEPLETGIETFRFPDPIGPLTVRSVAHEEAGTLPLFIGKGLRRCEFKYALDEGYVNILKVLRRLGLDREEPVRVGDATVAPRRVVTALLPQPADLTDALDGFSCVGTWVRGSRGDERVEQYIYTLSSHADARRAAGTNVTVWQAGTPPVIAAEMLADGTLTQRGALVPEQLPPDPWLARLPAWGMPVAIRETVERTLAPLSADVPADGARRA